MEKPEYLERSTSTEAMAQVPCEEHADVHGLLPHTRLLLITIETQSLLPLFFIHTHSVVVWISVLEECGINFLKAMAIENMRAHSLTHSQQADL